MKLAQKLKRLVQAMDSDTLYYTGTDLVPGLTYREPALVVTWTGGVHFVVAPRSGPVLTKTLDGQSSAWRDRFVRDMCTDPVPILMTLVRDYKDNAASFA